MTRALVISVVAIGGLAVGRQAQQLSAVRVADVMVPGPAGAVSFARPATPYSAFNTFVTLLEAANVRYGVEGTASDPAKPPFDFAREFERAVPLGGRQLRQALDEVVGAAPGFRWSDSGGTIVVRASADGSGILDQQLARFSISNATPKEAIEAVVAALDPGRTRGLGIQVRSNDAPAPRKVTLSLRDGTVQSVLTRLSREYGTLSWTVKYDAAPAGVATATIAFTTPDGFARAMSPAWLRAQSLDPQGRWRLGISSAGIADMLLIYADRAQLNINIEEIPTATSQTMVSSLAAGLPALELPQDPEQAIARIVALDSRYEWSQRGGRFLVNPKAGMPGRSALLDTTIPELSATNEPARSVIERVAGAIGSVRRSGGSSIGLGRGAMDDALATPIDVHRQGPLTIRDALNAIADATGWTWTTRPSASPRQGVLGPGLGLVWRGRGPRPTGARRGSPVTPSGNANTWSAAFVISTSPDASRPPAPAALTIPLPNPTLEPAPTPPPPPPYLGLPVTGESLRRAISLISRNHDALIGLEVVATSSATPRQVFGGPADRVNLGGLTIAETFAKIRELAPDYTIGLDKDVYHVRPRDAQRDSTPWLNHPVARFQERFENMREALAAVARLDWPRDAPAATVAPPRSDRTDALMKKTIVVSLRNVTIRDILDEIARRHGAMQWVVEQRVATSGPLVRVTLAGRDWSVTTTVR